MTTEARDPSQQPFEDISPQHEERFKELNSGIMEVLRPHSSLIVFSTDSDDLPNGYHLSINKGGNWSVGYGREGVNPLGSVPLRKLLTEYNFIRFWASSGIQIMKGDEFEAKLEEIRKPAGENLNEAAPGFLDSMNNALERYQGNPY